MSTVTATDIEKCVFDTLETFGVDRSEITREATLEQLDIDSLDMVELGQTLHEELGIDLEPKHFENVTTVGQALTVIEGRAAAA
jgi:acyl carrier protein